MSSVRAVIMGGAAMLALTWLGAGCNERHDAKLPEPPSPAASDQTESGQAARNAADGAVAPVPQAPSSPLPAKLAPPPEGMVFVPGGTIKMGVPEDIPGGLPRVDVSVGPFFIDRLEVTTGAYLACVEAGRCEKPASTPLPGCNAAARKPRLDHPINCITKAQAEQYCAAVGKRLPTEAEWEFAARGTDGRIYPWGNEPPSEQLCWQGREGALEKLTCPVGSFPQGASPFGALDMSGNVAEWTSTPETEAAGPGAFRMRGGGFPGPDVDPDQYAIRADWSRSAGGEYAFRDLGVRCARDIKP